MHGRLAVSVHGMRFFFVGSSVLGQETCKVCGNVRAVDATRCALQGFESGISQMHLRTYDLGVDMAYAQGRKAGVLSLPNAWMKSIMNSVVTGDTWSLINAREWLVPLQGAMAHSQCYKY